jgi:hypothetical protein
VRYDTHTHTHIYIYMSLGGIGLLHQVISTLETVCATTLLVNRVLMTPRVRVQRKSLSPSQHFCVRYLQLKGVYTVVGLLVFKFDISFFYRYSICYIAYSLKNKFFVYHSMFLLKMT